MTRSPEFVIGSLFPGGVVALTATSEMWASPLHPGEEVCVARAAPKRRREFTAGRNCARAALARLGVREAALAINDDRLPAWPSGVVGSITHRAGFCAVAVGRQPAVWGLGVDAELAAALSHAAIRQICRPGEIARQRLLPCADSVPWGTLLFSAKESAYKCYYAITRRALGLRDLEVTLHPESRSFSAALVRPDAPSAYGLRSFRGRYALTGGFVLTAVALTDGERRAASRAHRSPTTAGRPSWSVSTGQ